VVQNFITREELSKVVNKKPTSLFATLGAIAWALGAFILIIPLVVFTLLMLFLFFPFWFLENKFKGEDNV
tara:strand:- start:1715 stop:1924 length:210 start_codon:yes stop_codon:yes gene_type:complete